ncbi:hypothetical protein ABVT39_003117 [Epinephelus coioides]
MFTAQREKSFRLYLQPTSRILLRVRPLREAVSHLHLSCLSSQRAAPVPQRLNSLGILHCGGPLRSSSRKRRSTEGLQLSRTGLPSILHRFKATSDQLQKSDMDLATALGLLRSLHSYVGILREQFAELEESACAVSATQNYQFDTRHVKKRKKFADESGDDNEIAFTDSSQRFKVETYYVIIDRLCSCLSKRIEAYTHVPERPHQQTDSESERQEPPLTSGPRGPPDDLRHEVHQMKRVLQRKVACGIQKPSNIVELTNMIEPLKEVFHELFRLCKIAIAIPTAMVNKSSKMSIDAFCEDFADHFRSKIDDIRSSLISTECNS